MNEKQISCVFLIQYFCVVEFLILLGWHLANFRAIVRWFALPSVWVGTVVFGLSIAGIVASEWKVHSISKKEWKNE